MKKQRRYLIKKKDWDKAGFLINWYSRRVFDGSIAIESIDDNTIQVELTLYYRGSQRRPRPVES